MRRYIVLAVALLASLLACSDDDALTPPVPPEPLPTAVERPTFVGQWTAPDNSMDIGVSTNGHVFVSETFEAIHEYSSSGAPLGRWKPAALSGENLAPVYLEFARPSSSGPGSCYIVSAEPQPSRIAVFDERKAWKNEWPEYYDESGFEGGIDEIAVSPSGEVYRLRFQEQSVVKYNSSGEFEREWQADDDTPQDDNHPGGIAATDNAVYVADSRNGRILMFSPDGTLLKTFGSDGEFRTRLSFPLGLAVQGDVLFAVDWPNRRVLTYTLDGTFGGGFGTRDGTATPRLIAVQGRSVYVLFDSNTVQHYRYE